MAHYPLHEREVRSLTKQNCNRKIHMWRSSYQTRLKMNNKIWRNNNLHKCSIELTKQCYTMVFDLSTKPCTNSLKVWYISIQTHSMPLEAAVVQCVNTVPYQTPVPYQYIIESVWVYPVLGKSEILVLCEAHQHPLIYKIQFYKYAFAI